MVTEKYLQLTVSGGGLMGQSFCVYTNTMPWFGINIYNFKHLNIQNHSYTKSTRIYYKQYIYF